MRIHDSLIGLFFIVLGIAVIWQAYSFPVMPGQAIGPGTFPLVFGIVFVVGGLIVGRTGLATAGSQIVAFNEGWRHRNRALAAAIAILGTFVLGVFFEEIGFVIGGAVLIVALYVVQGHRSPLWLAVSLIFIALVYYSMAKLLLVPLPLGPLA